MASITSPIPLLPGVNGHPNRPRFSVMLPTYEPGEQLRRALQSVLSQAPAVEEMQIAVVDDGSRHTDVVGLVRSIDPDGRIELHVEGGHLGIAGNWNRAIGLARGHLVHLLHQDDQVLPGFYARMEQAFLRAPLIGMAFCRSSIIDTAGRLIKINSRQRLWPGVLSDWLPKISTRQRVQTPSVVVARTTYEILGGYRTDLCQTLDWEMWVRIAARFPVWYDPRPLALFRRHAASESARLLTAGEVWPDLAHAIRINAESLPAAQRLALTNRSAYWHAKSALREVRKRVEQRDISTARATLAHARGLLALIGNARQRSGAEQRAAALERHLTRLAAAA